MERKDFLKGIGLASLGIALPNSKLFADETEATGSCVLIPSETAGPFPLDLTANTYYFRQDIRETKTGTRLNLKLKILGLNNCLPMQNVRVNVWHCDKDGLYSGYSQTNNAGQAGLTYLRGYQMTDANGEVNFVTIFPGWYTGRICHIHFQVYVSSSYAAISQLTFDIATKNAIYAANSSLYTKGADGTTSYGADNIFSDGYTYQLASLTPNNTTGGYDAYLEVTVQGNGVISHVEKETAKQFVLQQNYPNPYNNSTTIPFMLKKSADVKIQIYDLSGKMISKIEQKNLNVGEHNVQLNMQTLGLASANYIYQIEVNNSEGRFTDYKMMTANK